MYNGYSVLIYHRLLDQKIFDFTHVMVGLIGFRWLQGSSFCAQINIWCVYTEMIHTNKERIHDMAIDQLLKLVLIPHSV